MFAYVDNVFFLGKTKEKCKIHTNFGKKSVEKTGLCIDGRRR